MAKGQQIKKLRIDVTTKGAKDAEKALQGINSELSQVQQNAISIGGFLKGPTKAMETLFSRSRAVSSSFDKMAKSAKAINTALAGGTNKANKNISAYMDNMELVSLTLMDVTKHADSANVALEGVNSTVGMKNLAEVLQKIEANTRKTSKGIKKTTSRIEDLDVTANRTTEELEQMGFEAREAAAGLTTTGRAAKTTDNNLRRLAGSGSQSTRAFSKMAFGMNPVTTLYAKLAINIFAVTEAFRILGNMADTTRLIENLGILSSQSGTNLSGLAREMQEVSGQSLSLAESSRLAARSIAQGFSSSQMIELTENAKRASIALGINFSDAMERLTKGIAKQEVELLDELGIVTRLEPAMKKYAASMGKTVEQLTDSERTTALYIEANKQLAESFSAVNIEATGVEVFTKAISSAYTELSIVITKNLDPILRALGTTLSTLMRDPIDEAEEFKKSFKETAAAVARLQNETQDPVRSGRLATTILEGRRMELKLMEEILAKKKQIEKEPGGLGSASQRQNVLKAELKALVIAKRMVEKQTRAGSRDLGLLGFSDTELTNVTKSLQSMTSGSVKLNTELGKLQNTFKGPLKNVLDAFSGITQEFNSLQTSVKDSAIFNGDLYRRQDAFLAQLGKKFGRTFLAMGEALDFLTAANERAARLASDKLALGIGPGPSSAAGQVGLRSKLLDIEIQILEAKKLAQSISPLEFELQSNILKLKEAQLVKDKEAAPFRDASATFAGMQLLSGLSDLQNTGLAMASSFTDTFAAAKEAGMGFSEFLMADSEAFLNFSATMANAASDIFSNLSKEKVAGIDREIAAEKKRDGKSVESLAKIKKLEQKKVKEQAKAKKAQVVMSTATAIMQGYAELGPIGGTVAAVAMAALGALQLSNIDKASNGSLAALSGGPSGMSITGGTRDNSVDISRNANAGEFAFASGAFQNATTPGRAGGGFSGAGASIGINERGPEVITPAIPVNVTPAGEVGAMQRPQVIFSPVLNITAMDTQSILDRAPELYEALELEINAKLNTSLEALGQRQ